MAKLSDYMSNRQNDGEKAAAAEILGGGDITVARAKALRNAIEVAADSLDDETIQSYPELCPAWESGKTYEAGARIQYEGTVYKVLQDHTSQDAWVPTDAPSLFAGVLINEDGTPAEWVQPDSTNGYMTGDRVLYNGTVYESLIDNNVWSPEAYPAGWKEVEE